MMQSMTSLISRTKGTGYSVTPVYKEPFLLFLNIQENNSYDLNFIVSLSTLCLTNYEIFKIVILTIYGTMSKLLCLYPINVKTAEPKCFADVFFNNLLFLNF